MPRVSGFFEGESASRSSTTTKACYPQKVPKLSEVFERFEASSDIVFNSWRQEKLILAMWPKACYNKGVEGNK